MNVALRFPFRRGVVDLVGLLLGALVIGSLEARPAAAQTQSQRLLEGVGIDQNLDAQVPLDLKFRDENGESVRLAQYFGHKPVILTMVYYRCPMLCTQVLNGLLKSSQGLPLVMGKDYDVVTVSFDPRETPDLAKAKKQRYVRSYRREGAAEGWHFLTGDAIDVERLAKTVGFRYRYDPASDQFAHGSAIMVLTPEGKISRYFYDIDYPPTDLRLALVESSHGKIGSPVDQLLLLCFHYDAKTGKYGLVISAVLQLAGSLTAVCLGSFLFVMYRQERRRTKQVAAAEAQLKSPEEDLEPAET